MSNVSDKSICIQCVCVCVRVASTASWYTICKPYWTVESNMKNERAMSVRRLFKRREKRKKNTTSISFLLQSSAINLPYTIVAKVLFHKNSAVHFISSTFSINFVLFRSFFSRFFSRERFLYLFSTFVSFSVVLSLSLSLSFPPCIFRMHSCFSHWAIFTWHK